MKRVGKVLLALMVLTGVIIASGIWLFDKTLNVVTDLVDGSPSSAQKVQRAAQKETVGAAQSAQNSAKAPSASVENASDTLITLPANEKTSTTLSADKTPEQSVGKGSGKNAGVPAVQTARNDQNDKDNLLGDFGGLVSLFLSDGDDSLDPSALLTAGDKVAQGDKSEGANSEGSLTDMIPGANSPTVKRWMAGKYKGKEAQALDDAIEDPKIWRLFFSLSGGM